MFRAVKKYENGGATVVRSDKQTQILDAINKVSGDDDKLRSLLQYTAMVENSMGNDSSAYNRDYTNSFMSLDDKSIDRIFEILPGARGFTSTQKAWQERFRNEYGVNSKEDLLKRLKNDEVELSIFTARAYYGMSPEALPEIDSDSLHNYWLKNYNSMGVVKGVPKDQLETELSKIKESYISKFEDWKSGMPAKEESLFTTTSGDDKEIVLKDKPLSYIWDQQL